MRYLGRDRTVFMCYLGRDGTVVIVLPGMVVLPAAFLSAWCEVCDVVTIWSPAGCG